MFIVKHIPKWFPGAYFQRQAREGSKTANAVLNTPYIQAKKRYVSNTPRNSMTLIKLSRHNQLEGTDSFCAVSQLIQDNIDADGNIQDEDVIAASVGALYIGERDTLASVLSY